MPLIMAATSLTEQTAMNRLYGSADTQYSVQAIANFRNGTLGTDKSFQAILNNNLGYPDTYYSQQVALFYTLQAELGLTGAPTRYTEQALLNMAYEGSIPIDNTTGEVDGLGTWGLLFLMAAA